MQNDEFTHYYGHYRQRSNYVIHGNVIHKGKTFQFRADGELRKNIENLSKELNRQADAKTIKDILEDFFLEQKLREQRFELSDLNKSELPKRF